MFVSAVLLTGGTLLLGGPVTRRPAPSPLVKLMLKADPRATPLPSPSAAEGSWQWPDLGSPGLRAYKEALQPVGFLKKYTIAARA